MRLIGIIVAIAVSLALPRLVAEGQQMGETYRIAYLSPAPRGPYRQAFDRALNRLGYVEGRNLRVEDRSTAVGPDGLAQVAAELAQSNVDVIVVWGPAATIAVKNATSTVPIVFLGGGAAVEQGLISSLPHPGGNLTGISFQAGRSLAPKYFEILKELIPKLSRVVVLRVPQEDAADQADMYEAAAKALNIRIRQIAFHRPGDLKEVLAAIEKERPQALLGSPSGLLFAVRHEIAEFAAKQRLPALFALRGVVEAGGLMSYGPDLIELVTRGAFYVDKILQGTKPGDLPVEQPTKFELVINLKTAQALGLRMPPSLMARADQVIE